MGHLIKDNPAAELARLEGNGFFAKQEPGQTKASVLYRAACREAAKFGQDSYLAVHYITLSGYCVGKQL